MDDRPSLAWHDKLFLETERLAQPFDGLGRIAITQAGYDGGDCLGGVGGYGLLPGLIRTMTATMTRSQELP